MPPTQYTAWWLMACFATLVDGHTKNVVCVQLYSWHSILISVLLLTGVCVLACLMIGSFKTKGRTSTRTVRPGVANTPVYRRSRSAGWRTVMCQCMPPSAFLKGMKRFDAPSSWWWGRVLGQWSGISTRTRMRDCGEPQTISRAGNDRTASSRAEVPAL